MKIEKILLGAAVLGMAGVVTAAVPFVAPNAMETPALRDVRLKGPAADKMNAFFRERMQSAFAQKEIFGEARRAFETRDDDIRGHGGLWRGEFWGKLMLGTARAADYLQDPELLAFVREECHRLMKLQDGDGYLGSYTDRELVSITDPEATRKTYGWYPCWNLWNRKYAIWGMLMAYKATGDKMDVAQSEDGVYTLTFDMPARLVERDLPNDPAATPTEGQALWMYNRYADNHPREGGRDVLKHYRKTPAATLWRGPLLLAKAKRVGDVEKEIFAPDSVNLKGYTPVLKPLSAEAADKMGVWGAWNLELVKPGTDSVRVRVCDFMSAGDDPRGSGAHAFSIWF